MADPLPHAKSSTLCGAKTRSGAPCRARAMENGRCRMHGGPSLRGYASGQFKHGRYSKYVPKRLLERYGEAERDPELLSLQGEIALLDARLTDLLGRADAGEAGKLWATARQAYTDLQFGMANDRQDMIVRALTTLNDTLGHGIQDFAAWSEIADLMDKRRKLVESERKRLVEARLMLSVEEASGFIVVLADIVRQYVTDRRVLAQIQEELARRFGATSRRTIDAGPLTGDGA